VPLALVAPKAEAKMRFVWQTLAIVVYNSGQAKTKAHDV
jgi:hypothetical protein